MGRTRRKVPPSIASSSVSTPMSSRMTSAATSRTPSPSDSTPRRAFRFFDLPAELRLRVYENVLHIQKPIDLEPNNYRAILPRLSCFLVCRRMHEEAYRVFYAQTIRLFPYHGRFFTTKYPLLMRLPPRYREVINTMELRLGPGWSKPPRCQNTQPRLGLTDCKNMRTLKIFVECDPSDDIFNGFRGANATEETYMWFCVDLLTGILDQVPSLETIEIDAWSGVKKDAPLIKALKMQVEDRKKRLVWGPLRGWEEKERPGLIGIENALASLSISSEAPRVLAVQA
ncbi:hypothetical protein HII31_08131 [Pseudocercospora fuligena]|uniref:F-box domain-containing protein n=1 Tax=Pseudocercospora fuligena TaxID=685502 RepID=A0A8H6RH41_9PEZI|nr:hypothetical protein HII31_08131 [Pseudocercospora fuligena]